MPVRHRHTKCHRIADFSEGRLSPFELSLGVACLFSMVQKAGKRVSSASPGFMSVELDTVPAISAGGKTYPRSKLPRFPEHPSRILMLLMRESQDLQKSDMAGAFRL